MSFNTRLAALLALTLIAPACKKADTNAPGGGGKGLSVAEAEAQRAQKQKDAKARTLTGLANEDLAKGRWKSAMDRAKRALEAEPNNAEAFAVLGAANWRAGDFEASTKAYKEALELDPKHFGASVGLGRNYQAVGDHLAAVELQDKILAGDPNQLDPLLCKLWSYYALADAANSVKTLDQIFKLIENDNPVRELLFALAGFMRPLEGKGELIKVEGTKGTADLLVDPGQGIKSAVAKIGGEQAFVVLFELKEEARVHKAFADKLKLKELGKIKPMLQANETSVVIIPEIAFGDLKLTNVPAIVDDLTPFGVTGDAPAVVLGRQALNKIGSITFDFPNAKLNLEAASPTAPPAGAVEAPLLLIDMHLLLAPATTLSIDGSAFKFYAWFGGSYGSSLAIARKEFLKSGHLPRELDPLDDANAGLKMVYLDKVTVGNTPIPGGVGGLVLANTPPDANIGQIVEGSSFELGGYINVALMTTMRVTYALSKGKMYLAPRGA